MSDNDLEHLEFATLLVEAFGDDAETLGIEFVKRAHAALEEAVDRQTAQLLEENAELTDMLFQSACERIFDDYTRGLSEVQKSRLRNLAVNIRIDDDNEPMADFETKLKALRDELYPNAPRKSTGIEDQTFDAAIPASREMRKYTDELRKLSGK